MTIFAIDPGPKESAFVVRRDGNIDSFGKQNNHQVMARLTESSRSGTVLVIEKIASYGMPVGEEVFETVYWTGRFAEAWRWCGHNKEAVRIPRKEICVHLCGSARARDANIRQACIDRVGPVGKKSAPGPTFGIVADVWAALAVALVAEDRIRTGSYQEAR
jgi:hypothetical protein